MELDFEDIHFIVEKSMEAAQLATVLALEPAGALLLESDIKRWLKYNISKGGPIRNSRNLLTVVSSRGIDVARPRTATSITTRGKSRRPLQR